VYTTAEHFLDLSGHSGHGVARVEVPVDDPLDAPVNVLVTDSAGGVL
jgi:hypothetical protein